MLAIRRDRWSCDPTILSLEQDVGFSVQIYARDEKLRRTDAREYGITVRGPAETLDGPPLWQWEIPLRAIPQIEYADLFAKLIQTRNGDARAVWRNMPLQVAGLSPLSPNHFLALPLERVQGIENELTLLPAADDTLTRRPGRAADENHWVGRHFQNFLGNPPEAGKRINLIDVGGDFSKCGYER